VTATLAPSSPSSTPTIRTALRRSAFWVVAGLAALLVAVISFIATGTAGSVGPPLAADNPAQAGSMALVEVLRQQGVTVVPVDTLDDAASALTANDDATLFFADTEGYLGADQLAEVGALAGRTVVADPGFLTLQTLAPAVGFGGVSTADTLTAQCSIAAAQAAEEIAPGGKSFGLAADSPGYTGCFPGGDGTFSMIERTTDDGTLTLVADTAVFANDEIATWGNAALALNLLGTTDTVIWYLPTLADVPVTGPPSLGALTPGWVTPALMLLVVTAVAAMVWRGRRFGPLVAENLPVVVCASETMEGRARLYARGNNRLRAVDAIRIGALTRMAVAAGLPSTAPLDQVVRTVAALTGHSPERVHATLVGELPHTDAALMALSAAISDLEAATATATRPAGSGPSPTPPPSTGRMEP
jgi:hypothetical protein